MGTNYAECQAGQAFELVDLCQDEWGFLAIANEKIGFSAIGKFKTRWLTLLSSSTPLPEKLALPWIDNFCPHARNFTLTKLALISYCHEELFIDNGETNRNISELKIFSQTEKLKLLKINLIRYNSFERKEEKSLKYFVFLQLH